MRYALRNGEPARPIRRVFIHISDRDPRTGEVFKNAAQVRDFHINVRGWRDIGYHYTVDSKGEIERGRPHWQMGAHAKGHNKDSLGICLLAADGQFTMAQIRFLKFLVALLLKKYSLSINDVWGHYQVNKDKTCPDFDIAHFRSLLRNL